MKPIQCRMARSALGWSTLDLAEKAKVGGNTINRFEAGQDARFSSVEKMQEALEKGGVEFIPENGGGLGVRLRKGRAPTDHRKPVGPATEAFEKMHEDVEKDLKRRR